jgi:hypothetical protein
MAKKKKKAPTGIKVADKPGASGTILAVKRPFPPTTLDTDSRSFQFRDDWHIPGYPT